MNLDEAQKRWPHLVFIEREHEVRFFEQYGKYPMFAQFGKDRPGTGLNFTEFKESTIEVLDREEANLALAESLSARYPYIHFAVVHPKVYTYVLHIYEGRHTGGAWIGYTFEAGRQNAADVTAELDRLNEECRKCVEEDYFFCAKHNRAEPKDEYGFFYFAGEFCKQTIQEDPALYDKARRERYD